jgi:hypothetical protein
MVFSWPKNCSLLGDTFRKTIPLYSIVYIGHTRFPLEIFVGPCGAGCTTGVPELEDFWTSSVNSLSSLNCVCIYNLETIFIGPPWGLLRNTLMPMYVNGHNMKSLGGRPAIRSYVLSSHQPFLIKHCCKNDISTPFLTVNYSSQQMLNKKWK